MDLFCEACKRMSMFLFVFGHRALHAKSKKGWIIELHCNLRKETLRNLFWR